MRKVPTRSGGRSTGSLSPATPCSAGSSATFSTSCCETDIQTCVWRTLLLYAKSSAPDESCFVNPPHPHPTPTAPFCFLSLQVIKDSMRNKADLTDMSRMWVRKQIMLLSQHEVTSHAVSQDSVFWKMRTVTWAVVTSQVGEESCSCHECKA